MSDIYSILNRKETAEITILEFINTLQWLTKRTKYVDIIKYIEYLDYLCRMDSFGKMAEHDTDFPEYKFFR